MAQQADCVFCRIVTGEIPAIKVFEDRHSIAFMDINPATDGHTLVIPKAHFENLLDIEPAVLTAVTQSTQVVARAIYRALAPQGMRIAQFNDAGAGQTVFHYHVHLRPAYHERMGNIHGEGTGDMNKINRLAEKIRRALEQQ